MVARTCSYRSCRTHGLEWGDALMQFLVFGLAVLIAGCTHVPRGSPPATHVCVEIPNDLVECSEAPQAE